jgi:glycosyltransferase involved in cell wall biosynthesis
VHVLLVADGRSPHTAGWLAGMARLGITTTLLSSRLIDANSCARIDSLIGTGRLVQPGDLWSQARPRLAFASPSRHGSTSGTPTRPTTGLRSRVASHLISPSLCMLDAHAANRLTGQLERLVRAVRPDAVHALRVQHEGIATAGVRAALPVAISTWGQDLVSTAGSSPRLARQTRSALGRADVLMSDCRRDAALADAWGLRSRTPRHVIPGNFGVDLDRFPAPNVELVEHLGLGSAPLVVFPRGVRGFVNYRGFLAAANAMLSDGVEAAFLGVGLTGVAEAARGVSGVLRCTGPLDHPTMLALAASSAVTVSPAYSDGIPNSVLEGMAGGSIPVCGDIDSLRELESHGAVIAWCDPSNAESIASAIASALRLYRNPAARYTNRRVISEHYSVSASLGRARAAYQDLATARRLSLTDRGKRG